MSWVHSILLKVKTYCMSIILPLPPWLPPKKLVTLPPHRPHRLLRPSWPCPPSLAAAAPARTAKEKGRREPSPPETGDQSASSSSSAHRSGCGLRSSVPGLEIPFSYRLRAECGVGVIRWSAAAVAAAAAAASEGKS